MSTMFPEPVAVAEPPAPLAVRRKPNRKSWTQASVADLVLRFSAAPGFAATAEERAKLIELGLIARTEKPTLSDSEKHNLQGRIEDELPKTDPHRTLAVRHAMKYLQSLLPKRAEK